MIRAKVLRPVSPDKNHLKSLMGRMYTGELTPSKLVRLGTKEEMCQFLHSAILRLHFKEQF